MVKPHIIPTETPGKDVQGSPSWPSEAPARRQLAVPFVGKDAPSAPGLATEMWTDWQRRVHGNNKEIGDKVLIVSIC